MIPQQIQSDLRSIRRGLGVALGLGLFALVWLAGEFFGQHEGGRGVAAGVATFLLILAGLQLWQCRHEVSRLEDLLS